MKLLPVLLLLVSTQAFSQTKKMNVNVNEFVEFTCSDDAVFQLSGNVASCVCPSMSYPIEVQGKTICRARCDISLETHTTDNCDQGGCGQPYDEDYLVVRKNGRYIHGSRIYDRRSREIEILLPKAKAVAQKNCYKTFYNGEEI